MAREIGPDLGPITAGKNAAQQQARATRERSRDQIPGITPKDVGHPRTRAAVVAGLASVSDPLNLSIAACFI